MKTIVRACETHGRPLVDVDGERMRCPGTPDANPHLVVTWLTIDADTGAPLARAAADEHMALRDARSGDAVLAAIRKTAGNASAAARLAGCSRETVYSQLRARRMAPDDFRAAPASWKPPPRKPGPRVGVIARLDAIEARMMSLEGLLREFLAR